MTPWSFNTVPIINPCINCHWLPWQADDISASPIHWIKTLRGVLPFSFHKWKKVSHFRCLLDWVYILCSIKFSIPARFSIGPQMMPWLISWVWAACDSNHSSAGRTRKHLDTRTAPQGFSLSVSYQEEHQGKASTVLSCMEGWDEIYQRNPKELHVE